MKKLLLAATCSLFSFLSYSQTYTLLGSDPKDQFGTPDIKSVSYSLDLMKDSIWLKIEMHNAIKINNDFGMVFGLDTNQKPTDGTTWVGENISMKYDHALIIFKNGMFSTDYEAQIGKPGATNKDIKIKSSRPDDYTFLFALKLSEIDKDGKFNLLVGSSTFDVAFTTTPIIWDDAPNQGTNYYSVPVPTGCTAPATLTITDVKDISAMVAWPAVTGAMEYEGAVTTSATPPASGKATTGTSATITGLTAKTSYYAHVRTKCNATTYSAWTTKAFSTATTGINDLNTSSAISVYPNPVNDQLSVSGLSKGDNIKIISITGTEVISTTATSKELEINLTSFPSGIYFLHVKNESSAQTLKIVKQ
jgi:hypothetical protein